MALQHSPSIVTDGIVLLYDEDSNKSGNTSELVLGRAATVQSSTERRFALDTLISSCHASAAEYGSTATGTGFSFSTWIRRTGNTTGNWDQIVGIDGGGPTYRMLWFGFYAGETSRIHCSMPYWTGVGSTTWFSVDPYFTDAGITFEVNKWYNFCATYTNSSRVLMNYINGRFAASGTRGGSGDLNNPNGSPVQLFGCNGVSSQNSQLRTFTMYNRPLTEPEVLQNFNALRGRFGI